MTRPRTVFGWLMVTILALAIVMAVTGALLATVYRPATGTELAYQDIEALSSGSSAGRLASNIHPVAAWLLSFAVGALVVERMVAAADSRTWRAVATTAALSVTTLALLLTGRLLPWDGFAIWAVPGGTFYIVDGVEVGVGTMRRWFLLHTVALSALWAVLVAATAWLSRRPSSGDRQGDAV